MKVAIVGAGMIGRAWAISFARGSHQVQIWNRTGEVADAAIVYIRSLLPLLDRNGLLNGHAPDAILARIAVAPTIEEALDGADYVQESVSEDLAVKTALYSAMEPLCRPDTILGSSTSGLVTSAFSSHLKHPERCLVVHPLNPPYLIPAVDVVPSPATSAAVVDTVARVMRECGQSPIVMRTEDPGFLTIRLQGAIYHEAFRLVASGLARVEDVDACIRDGLALRWSFMGPFETADLNAPGGVRDFVARYGPYYRDLYPTEGPVAWAGALLDEVEADRRALLPMEDHGARQAWRDRRLIALMAHKRAAERADAEAESGDAGPARDHA